MTVEFVCNNCGARAEAADKQEKRIYGALPPSGWTEMYRGDRVYDACSGRCALEMFEAKEETVVLPAPAGGSPEDLAAAGIVGAISGPPAGECAFKGCGRPAQAQNMKVPLCAGHSAAVFGAMSCPADLEQYGRLLRAKKPEKTG